MHGPRKHIVAYPICTQYAVYIRLGTSRKPEFAFVVAPSGNRRYEREKIGSLREVYTPTMTRTIFWEILCQGDQSAKILLAWGEFCILLDVIKVGCVTHLKKLFGFIL